MLLTLKLKLAMVALAAGPLGAVLHWEASAPQPAIEQPELVALAPGAVRYRVAGDFIRAGKPTNAPAVALTLAAPPSIMRQQVTPADYRRCVQEGACPAAPLVGAADGRPLVKVSFRDAEAYAAWLSQKTGWRYRLPSDEEWAYAAGSRFTDDASPETDSADPAVRWLARYAREAERESDSDKEPQVIGSFGANEHGLLDLAGNVWEWTSTCFRRVTVAADGETAQATDNCGVRVVEGRHRAYMTDFVRDPRTGGCAAGKPPSNLGFRLVRDPAASPMARFIGHARAWWRPRQAAPTA